MKSKKGLIVMIIFLPALAGIFVFAKKATIENEKFVSYIVDPKKQELKFYLRDDKLVYFKSINTLKLWLDSKSKKLEFAMNGGMYKQDNSPLGLFIENRRIITPLNTASADGNFYLKPNGVFYITTDNLPVVCNTTIFKNNGKIKYATQSGPMLLINGEIHTAFKENSTNFNIRNGVGILPNNTIVFAMSKTAVSFYEFANYFKSLGCKNALYLDGAISQTYLPSQNWVQTGGNFGVIIGVTTTKK